MTSIASAVIDWLLHLPEALERKLWVSIEELERNANMPYVTSVQRIGRQEGCQEGEATLLRRQLIRRFGPLPEAVETRLTQASTEQLEVWGEKVLEATSLEEVLDKNKLDD